MVAITLLWVSEGERRESTMTSIWWTFLYLNMYPDALCFCWNSYNWFCTYKDLDDCISTSASCLGKLWNLRGRDNVYILDKQFKLLSSIFFPQGWSYSRDGYMRSENWLWEKHKQIHASEKECGFLTYYFVKVEICFALLKSLISEIINYLMGYFEINTFNI